MTIIFLDTVHSILWERLTDAGMNCIDATNLSKHQIIEQLNKADGIVIRSRFRMDAEILDYAPKIKFIARSGAGMENIDEHYCSSRGIQLFNAPEGNRSAVGEHALGMLLTLFNNLVIADGEVRKGIWNREGNRGVELNGKTVGIIGFGNNGAEFAKKLSGFETRILAYDKYKSGFGNNKVEEVELEDLYNSCDVVSFHIPQTEETLFFADLAFFEKFKRPIYLINLSRGKVVKTSALVSAMKSGKVKGACLDVLEYEKSDFESFFQQELSDDFTYLLNSKNVILSPHVGGWTHESYFKLSNVLADKILAEFC